MIIEPCGVFGFFFLIHERKPENIICRQVPNEDQSVLTAL